MLYIKLLFRIVQYIFELIGSLILTIFIALFSRIVALFVDVNGNLPKYLRWFQTPDATCYDEMWVEEHPTWSKYKIAHTWLVRNPAYGFRKWCSPSNVNLPLVITSGELYIADGEKPKAGRFFLVNSSGYWNFSYVIDLRNGHCMRGEWGWYLLPLAKGYDSVNTGMLISDLIRFYNFGTKGN
jgi:hypothetical protein